MNDRALGALGLLLAATHSSFGDHEARRSGPVGSLDRLHARLREIQAREPMTATALTVLLGAAAFYAAERKENPKVASWHDAVVYASTNISVGYSDILAKTPLGKLIGSLLMTYGPALADRAFDPAAPEQRAGASENENAIIARLDAILEELRARRAPSRP
jgi:hypothetical protein